MRKEYPYLQDSWISTEEGAAKRRNFLKTIDNFVNQKQYVKITLLNWHEDPIKELEGELSSGNITKDGSSAIRRTCSLSASLNRGEYNIEDADMDFAINKKVFIEIGIKNYSDEYPEYPILWFPQGVFFIVSCSINSSTTSAVNISLSLKDKMCGLTGDIGGKFPATVILDEVDTQNAAGEYVTEKVLLYNIIQEMVHHYGGEDLNNIVIEDVPLRIKRVMKWTGSNPLYLVQAKGTSAGANNLYYNAYLEVPEDTTSDQQVIEITNGNDAGYIYDDLVYTGELIAAPGESVTSVLDKIKQLLGNYEYFYDVFGVFHFREIKNYLNTTQGKILLDDMKKNDYLVEVTSGKSTYTFSDNSNIISIAQNPKYENIKNDYVVQGLRQMTGTDISYPVRYHLAIDTKPKVMNIYQNLLLYQETNSNLIKAAFPQWVKDFASLPLPGNFNLIYYYYENEEDISTYHFYYWENDVYKEVKPYEVSGKAEGAKSTVCFWRTNDKDLSAGYQPTDWRSELYLRGLLMKNKALDSGIYFTNLIKNPGLVLEDKTWKGAIARNMANERIDTSFYFEELEAFWPQIYDLANHRFYAEEKLRKNETFNPSTLTDGNYFLDFIDSNSSGLGQYSVQNIGRRSDVVVDEEVNCLFQPDIPDIVFINQDDDNRDALVAECQIQGQPFTQVRPEIYWAFATGGYKNGAFDKIKYELYLHTNYQKTVTITALPVFYLEPNVRIDINDKSTNTYDDFMLQNISFALGAGNIMSVTANECFERF